MKMLGVGGFMSQKPENHWFKSNTGRMAIEIDDYAAELMRLAAKSNMKQKHGALVIDRAGRIVARGWNRWLKVGGHGPRVSIHAEEHAIGRVHPDVNIKNCSIIVCRVVPSGAVAYSYPCDSCMALIERVELRKVYYT